MTVSLLQIWSVIGLAVLAGLPIALIAGRTRVPLWTLLAESAALGLLWHGIAGLVLARWFGSPDAALLAVAVLPAAAASVVVWRRGWRPPRPRFGWDVAVVAGLLALASVLRGSPVHFVYAIGDFGDYIAGAGELARDGTYPEGFLPLLTVLLGSAERAVGPDDLTVLASALGVLLVIMVGATLERLSAPRPATVLAMALVAVGAVPSWFGSFPMTETLYSVVLVCLVYFLVGAAGPEGGRLEVAGVVVAAIALGLTRGNALLLAVLLVLACALLALRLDPAAARRVAWACVGAAAGVWLTALYAIRYHNAYFVQTQLANFAPGDLLPLAERLDEPPLAAAASVAVLAILGAWFALVMRLNRTVSARPSAVWPNRLWVAALALGLAGAAALVLRIGRSGLVDAGLDFGLLVIGLAAVGALHVLVRSRDDRLTTGGTVALMVAATYCVLYASRFPEPAEHSFYRYWQRYLFSDVFPVTMILVGLGAGALLLWGGRIVRFPDRPLAGALALLAVGGALLATIDDGRLGREHVLFEDDYEQIAAIAALIEDRERPVLYDGFGGFPGFPNSFRPLGAPLARSHGIRLVNLPDDAFAPDPRVSADDLAAASAGREPVYVLSVGNPGGGVLTPPPITSGRLSDPETLDFDITILRHTFPQRDWEFAPLRAELRTFEPGPPVNRFVGFGRGFGKSEPDGGVTARWTRARRAMFTIETVDPESTSIRLRLRSFVVPREVAVLADGRRIAGARVGAGRPEELAIETRLPRGRHTITLVTRPGVQSIAESTGTADDRSVALRVYEPITVR